MTIEQLVTTEVEKDRPSRPLPRPSALTLPFWEACADGKLLYQTGRDDERPIFPPQKFSPFDLSTDLIWRESSGTGEIYTYTVVSRPQTPAFDAPYVVAVVTLDEGYAFMTNIINCDPADVRIGMKVKVAFRVIDGFTLPFFEPAAAS